MEQVACPVCTLYLREGITLQNHLYTHPKSQVIEALVRLAASGGDLQLMRPTYSTPALAPVPPQPSAAAPQHVTSITYQQFLSSTTSIVNPPLIPHPPSFSHISKPVSDCNYQQYPVNGPEVTAYATQQYPTSRSAATIQYTQLHDYTFRNEGNDCYNPAVGDASSEDATNNSIPVVRHDIIEKHAELTDDRNRPFTMTNIGTVITDSHRVISNTSPNSLYSSYPNHSDHNKQGWEDTAPFTGDYSLNDEAHSPSSSRSSACSVRVRKDLSDSNINDENSFIQLTPPRGNYIIPNYDYGDDTDNVDNAVAEEQMLEHSLHSIPLNIHTDESMPPRGELSGQGTNSSVWQVNNENLTDFGSVRNDRWGNNLDEEKADEHHSCSDCNKEFSCAQEMRMHVSLYHQHPVITESAPPAETLPPSQQDTFSSVFVKAEKVRVIEEVKTVIKEQAVSDSKDNIVFVKPRRKPRTCRTCDMAFSSISEYKQHVKSVHPLECTVCGKCFLRHSGLTLHQRRHLKIKPYKCDLCDKSFVTNQKLLEHHNCHTGEKPIQCPVCPQTFRRYSNLIQHKYTVHLKLKRKVKDFYCWCGEVFHSKRKLSWHLETHDTKPKQCLYCNERYVHTASLTRHIRRMHDQSYLPKMQNDVRVNVECPICHRIFLKGSLQKHVLLHSGIKPFSCNTCGKKFLTKWNMKMHQWTHAARASKPFKCKLCKAAFVRKVDYLSHQRSHKNVRPYSCNHCGQQFAQKYNCLRHTREHEESKTFKCEVCNKNFHRSYYLKEHIRVHTGVKPYSCHICSKTTATKTNHNKHVKTHHAREPVNSEN